MGIIFRKSKKIAPGVKMNLTQSGTSFSFGGKGARYSVGSKRSTFSFKIPGTNLRWRTSSSNSPSAKHKGTKNNIDFTKVRAIADSNGGRGQINYSKKNNDLIKANWGCAFIVLGLFLFGGFLMGGYPWIAIGCLAFFILLRFIIMPKRK